MRIGHRAASRGDRGFTLIELMIALLIGVFLLGALLTIVQTNRTVFGDQNKMAQLQDGERMAMTMMADVIQSAGYFPQPYQPYNNTLTGALIAHHRSPLELHLSSPDRHSTAPIPPARRAMRSPCAT